jgi:hypothetical protein
MNPNISKYVSDTFYEGAVESAPICNERVLNHPHPHYNAQFPILVVDIDSPEERGGQDLMSTTNYGQVNFFLHFLPFFVSSS